MNKCDFLGSLSQQKQYAPVILRVVLGIIFLAHGYGKIWGSPGIEGWIGFAGSLGLPVFVAWLVALAEFLGGIMLIVGLGTRYNGLILAIIMLVAIFKVKLSSGLLGGYELDFALLAMAVSLMLTGSGPYSVDQAMGCK